MMKLLLKNARILSMKDDQLIEGDIVVNDNKILYIGTKSDEFAPFDEIHDCLGNVLMPGFKNAHTHSAMSFLRSKWDNVSLQDWLFKYVIPYEAHLTPDDVCQLAKVSFLEYLTSGITACFDQYYFPEATGKAAYEIGMRCRLLGTYNSSYNANDLVNLYNKFNSTDGLVKYNIGMHAEYTSYHDELLNVSEAIHRTKSPFYAHVCENEKEVQECLAKRGITPIQFFEEQNMYDYGGGGYHCCFMSDEDIEIFKKHKCFVVTCPGSNTKLASGIAPIVKYLEAGLDIAIGTDGPASNNCLDMFKEMTLLFSLQKVILKDPKVLQAYDVLKMATVNGARAMSLDDCDVLDVGKKADIIEIDLSKPNMQPLNNIVGNIVYSGSKDNVKMTMIDGKILYLDGKFFVNEPVEEIYRKCSEITNRIEREILQK